DVDLRSAFLVDVRMKGVAITRTQMDACEAYGGSMDSTVLAQVSAVGCDLQELGMSKCTLREVAISGATLTVDTWTSMRQDGAIGWEDARIVARDPHNAFAQLMVVEARELCR